jgi:tRNA (adenine57-N1/adenine58-N1)-methyltransferase catalytic subunit
MIATFETLLRTWNIQGRSVRPDHRMVAHSGFLTVARKIEPGLWRKMNPGSVVLDDVNGDRMPDNQEDPCV